MTNERNHSHLKVQAETIPINNVYLKLLLNYMCSLRCSRNSIQTKYGVYRFHVRHSEQVQASTKEQQQKQQQKQHKQKSY